MMNPNQKISAHQDAFLKCDQPKQRLKHLESAQWNLSGFDIEQLFLLPFSSLEKIHLIEACQNLSEELLIGLIKKEDQDIAVCALLKWCTHTPGLRFKELVHLAGQKNLPQRLRYRLLDELKFTGGKHILKALLDTLQYEDISHATRSLLVQRCLEWGYEDDKVSLFAVRTLFEVFKEDASYPKDILGLIYYIKAFAPDAFTQMQKSEHVPILFREVLGNLKSGVWQRYLEKKISLNDRWTEEQIWENLLGYSDQVLEDAVHKSPQTSTLKDILRHRLDTFEPPRPKLRPLTQQSTRLQDFLEFLEETDDISQLSTKARLQPWVHQCFYLRKLGSLQGSDQARLRVLEYANTHDPLMLHEVIRALSAINTSQAHLELIHLLTRTHVDIELQNLIVTELESKNLDLLQPQLRATIRDLAHQDRHVLELQDRLSQLLTIPAQNLTPLATDNPDAPLSSTSAMESVSELELEGFLLKNISCLKSLSTEVKRALKTAAFVHLNRSQANMDLSPVVDMQYKSLELFFREHFEENCVTLVKSGILQTKLDLMGYARPIEQQMNRFEDEIQSLPIIADIPYFSRFKMRKFLRSICQYRPGKRFGFDGLKAYALFFLCFSRQNDHYGLKNLLPLGFQEDHHLFQYCYDLHTLQDLRNRAAHEGLAPNTPTEAIWQKTSQLLNQSLEIVHKNLRSQTLHSA